MLWMIDTAAAREACGPLERTTLELAHIERAAMFRRHHRPRARSWLQRSDELLRLVEECRVRGLDFVPLRLWIEVARFIGLVDSQLRDDLGTDRGPSNVADVLFMCQGPLLQEARVEQAPHGPAPIIPLFAAS